MVQKKQRSTYYHRCGVLILLDINARPEMGVQVHYSTPALYVQAIKNETAQFPLNTYDFLPYQYSHTLSCTQPTQCRLMTDLDTQSNQKEL